MQGNSVMTLKTLFLNGRLMAYTSNSFSVLPRFSEFSELLELFSLSLDVCSPRALHVVGL